MKFLNAFISFITNKYQYKIYSDYFVNDEGRIFFTITPISKFMPEAIPLEELIGRPEILDRLDPESAKYFAESYAYIEKLVREHAKKS